MLGAQPLQHGFVEHAMQLAPADADLRQLIAGVAAARLAVDELAETVEKNAFKILDAGRLQLGLQAQLSQFAHRVRQQGDAHADLAHLGNGFVEIASQAPSVQGQCQAEAPDAGADDCDLHGLAAAAIRP